MSGPSPALPRVLVALGLLNLALLAAVVVLVLRAPPPAPPSAVATPAPVVVAPPPAKKAAGAPVGFHVLDARSPLDGFADVALAGSDAIVTDGKKATLVVAGGEARPLEVKSDVPRVFSAGGRLFALADNQGAPYFIAFTGDWTPVVIPMPCRVTALGGSGDYLLGLCADAATLAMSRDGGKSFSSVLPGYPTHAPEGAELRWLPSAVGATGSGTFVVGVTEHWRTRRGTDELLWSFSSVGVNTRRDFIFASLPGLAAIPALLASDTGHTLAALELGNAAEGGLQPRVYRSGEGQPFVASGELGPACGAVTRRDKLSAVLVSPSDAVYACEGKLVVTNDGGRSWVVEPLEPGEEVVALRAGELRVLVRTTTRTLERTVSSRAASGAMAVPVARGTEVPGVPASKYEAKGRGFRLIAPQVQEPAQ